MKFSIIICTFNAVSSLHRTLDSILPQTHDDYEVVIIDGASTDGTQEEIRDYEDKFNRRLRWISEPDSGIYYAMNKGINMVSGEWIYFLGSGDTFYNARVLEQVNDKIIIHNCDIVYGDVEWGQTGSIYDGKFTKEKLIWKNICHQAIFYRRNIFDKIGKFDTKYTVLADWAHNIKWLSAQNIKSEYINVIISKFELGGWSTTVLDKNFYADMEDMVKKYFPHKYQKIYREIRGYEIKVTKNSTSWKLWEWGNKIKFALFSPRKFVRKHLWAKKWKLWEWGNKIKFALLNPKKSEQKCIKK